MGGGAVDLTDPSAWIDTNIIDSISNMRDILYDRNTNAYYRIDYVETQSTSYCYATIKVYKSENGITSFSCVKSHTSNLIPIADYDGTIYNYYKSVISPDGQKIYIVAYPLSLENRDLGNLNVFTINVSNNYSITESILTNDYNAEPVHFPERLLCTNTGCLIGIGFEFYDEEDSTYAGYWITKDRYRVTDITAVDWWVDYKCTSDKYGPNYYVLTKNYMTTRVSGVLDQDAESSILISVPIDSGTDLEDEILTVTTYSNSYRNFQPIITCLDYDNDTILNFDTYCSLSEYQTTADGISEIQVINNNLGSYEELNYADIMYVSERSAMCIKYNDDIYLIVIAHTGEVYIRNITNLSISVEIMNYMFINPAAISEELGIIPAFDKYFESGLITYISKAICLPTIDEEGYNAFIKIKD